MTGPAASADLAAPTLLCVHPNYELYGSDRTFVQAVRAFRARWPQGRITVLLPREGLLADVIRSADVEVRIEPILVLRRSRLKSLWKEVPAVIFRVARCRRLIRAADLTYINTIVVLDFLLAARTARSRVLVHVHELPTGRARTFFARLLAWSRATFIFISEAVRDTFPELAGRPSEVIWNGTQDVSGLPPLRAEGPLHLLLIGRFNSWKGQTTLLDAVAMIPPARRAQLRVRLLGGVFEDQHHFLEAIEERIVEHELADCVEIVPFDPDPSAHFGWADAIVVPSTKPEPFGLVAIEAMAARRAVIAADHGGLAEIVIDGVTGQKVASGSPAELANAIERYLADRALLAAHGAAGHRRYQECFKEEQYQQRLVSMVERALKQRARIAA